MARNHPTVRMPAEWEPHEATWFSWPHNPDTWVHHLAQAERALAQGIQALRRGEAVHVNVLDEAHAEHVRGVIQNVGGEEEARFPLHLHIVPTNDSWIRDHGAIFVQHTDAEGSTQRVATDWGFNAWGGKYPPFDLDDAVPRHMARILDAPRVEGGMILEGGSIETDGQGTFLTTERCLLNPNRNPDLDREAIETLLRQRLGAQRVVWLDGDLVGDDTDAHIDNLARFLAPGVVAVAVETNPDDPNFEPTQDTLARVRRALPEAEVVELPMPAPLVVDGVRLPASYANFYVGNAVVLLPAYGGPADEAAARLLQTAYPNREVVPVDAQSLIWGLGSFHCLSQQVPAVQG